MANLEIDQLVAAGDRDGLERLRADLVQRLYTRSDDHEASSALKAVNQALSEVGWRFPFDWRRRRKP